MDINRNQWFLAGLLLLMLGIQFRLVDSFVLTPKATKVLAKQVGHPAAGASDAAEAVSGKSAPLLKMNVRPPDWLGWSLVSFGAVLILHSLAMPRPG